MKTHTKILALTVLILGSVSVSYAGRMDGIWTTRDNRITVEIRDYERGIRLKQGNQTWADYSRKGNRYQSKYGSFCRLLDDNTIEWYDRKSRDRYTLVRNDRYRERYQDDRRGYDDYKYSESYRGDRDYRQNDRYRGNSSGLDGKWYNESSGQHIHVKPKRDGLRIKFRGERWINFRPRSNGVFEDGYGNKWILYRNYMKYESFNRDFTMSFSKGEYRGRRHECYFRF